LLFFPSSALLYIVAEGTTYGALKKPHTILDLISFNTGLKAL
jgi:hypothetical protein